ncbi:MAG: hypothetical protein AAB074_11700 [Planctomycetota bacterium]
MPFCRLSPLLLALLALTATADPEPLDGGKDRTEEARTFVRRGLDLAKGGDSAELRAYAKELVLADTDGWIKKVFGDDAAVRVAARIATRQKPIDETFVGHLLSFPARQAVTLKVKRIDSAGDDESFVHRGLIRSMKSKESIYEVFLRTDDTHFALDLVFADGAFRWIPDLERAADTATLCKVNLTQLGIYMLLYELKHKFYPLEFADLKAPDLAQDDDLFTCPTAAKGTPEYSYCYPFDADVTNPDYMTAWESAPHENGTRMVLRFCGRAEPLKEADFQSSLAAQRKASVNQLKWRIQSNGDWPFGVDVKDPPRERRLKVLQAMLKECEEAK